MAKKASQIDRSTLQPHMRTSIGSSTNSRPTNKSKRRSFKKYRGQGRK